MIIQHKYQHYYFFIIYPKLMMHILNSFPKYLFTDYLLSLP
jgi:hypothetical protein